jgi:SH3 domain-containing YSC84-like protein 1
MKIRTVMLLTFSTAALFGESEPLKRLDEASSVLSEIMDTPDKSIPQSVLDKSECIVIVPGVKKAAFIVGGKYGRGFLSCRKKDGAGWTGPAAVRVEGGSVGLQIGGSETDAIMLVMNERGMQKLLSSKFTLGADVSVAAGPVGRTASADTDATMRAEILTWSRSRGVFAGVALNGATLRQDLSTNKELYGKATDNKTVVNTEMAPPKSAERLLSLLNKYSSRKGR